MVERVLARVRGSAPAADHEVNGPGSIICAGRDAREATLNSIDDNDENTGRTWFLRIASIVGIVGVIAAIGLFVRKGDTTHAVLLLFTVPVLVFIFSRSWTGSLFAGFESAKRYVDGVEGDHRHEWYAFRGERVRVFLDAKQQPWFVAKEIAYILDLKVDKSTFRTYGPQEYGIPESASERCLSERGLRRLIKYSAHRDAGALGLWLERDVLRVLRRKREFQETNAPMRNE
jgi:hypothetical protein